MALQGERGSASFFLETENGRAIAALKAGRRSRSYPASGMASCMGGNRNAGSVATAIQPGPEGTPPQSNCLEEADARRKGVELFTATSAANSLVIHRIPFALGLGQQTAPLQRLDRG